MHLSIGTTIIPVNNPEQIIEYEKLFHHSIDEEQCEFLSRTDLCAFARRDLLALPR